MSSLSDQDLAVLAFYLTPGIGAATYAKLLEHTGLSAHQLLQQSHHALRHIGLNDEQINALKRPNPIDIGKVEDWLAKSADHALITQASEYYPDDLKQIASAPLLLFANGNLNALKQAQIAIVGSRNPSASGKQIAKSFAAQLSEAGWVITSGLALGVDGCAHQGAVAAQGVSVAVLGTGVDHIYPKRHQKLAAEILDNNGCILSELLPGTPARAENFPRRNRIISGLSLGTLIVEAAIKSGSLITAKYALEQNRDVFAIPGHIHNPLAHGCHQLIQQGAKLVQSIDDINEEYQTLSFTQPERAAKNREKNDLQNLASDKLLDNVDYEVTSLDVVAERSGIPAVTVMAQLLEYELRGLVASVPGGYIKLGGK